MMVEDALKTKGNRVKYLRNLTNLERQAFCNQSGINFHTYKSWELDKMSGITANGCQQVISFISKRGVSATVEWIMEGAGPNPTLNADQEADLLNERLSELIIKDDSMAPLIEKGGAVFYKKRNSPITGLEAGRVYVIKFDGSYICRVFQQNELFCSYKRTQSVQNSVISKELVSEVFVVSRIINS